MKIMYTSHVKQVTDRMRYENSGNHFRQQTGGPQVHTTMTNTALDGIGETTEIQRPIKNPYKRNEIKMAKVSLSPDGCYITKHKSWLAGSGQRQPPPTHELRCEKAVGEKRVDEGTIKETNETEVIHGDHGVFLCRNRGNLFLIVPIQDEWGVPDIEATLHDAASIPDSEVKSTQEILQPKHKQTFREEITTQAKRIANEKCKNTPEEDPQWIRSTYPSIPTMTEISDLLCSETDAIRFLANRGVIDPCGICVNCKGK